MIEAGLAGDSVATCLGGLGVTTGGGLLVITGLGGAVYFGGHWAGWW
jgi:hypothetical protein